jgi:ABC-type nitrate/sulfonate/bicarbonate transport system substrate-binding protein
MSSKQDRLSAAAGTSRPGLIDRRLFLRLAGAGLAGAGITVGLGACGFGGSTSKPGGTGATSVAPMNFIQGSASLEWAPVQLATAAGYFKEFGVDPTVTYQGSGGTTTNVGAVLSGGVDAGGQVGSALSAVRAGGADIRIIGVLTNRIGVKVVLRSDVAARLGVKETDPLDKRIRALQGLRIGTINLGGGVYFALQYALRRQNIDLSKFATVTGIDPQDAIVAAMQSGRIDAGALSSPYGEIATQGGKAIVLLTTSKGEFPELQNQIFTCIYVRNNYANDKARKELLGRFMTALAKAQSVIATQPQTAKTHLAPLFSTLPSDVFAQAFADTGFSSNPIISSSAFDDTRRYQEAASGKTLAISFDDVVDNNFAKAAVANIKGK